MTNAFATAGAFIIYHNIHLETLEISISSNQNISLSLTPNRHRVYFSRICKNIAMLNADVEKENLGKGKDHLSTLEMPLSLFTN